MGTEACTHDVDAIERGLGRNIVLVNVEIEVVVADNKREMLGHLVFVDDLADPHPDGVLALQPGAFDHPADRV